MPLIAWVLAGAAPIPALAADPAYPSRVVTLVAPQQPGSATDKVARTVAAALEQHWGSPVIVENKAGAGGTIGAGEVARAAPDGYTLLLGGFSHMIVSPAVLPDARYDVTRDFHAFGRVAVVPFVFAVHPSVPATTLPELVALSRAEPGKLNVAALRGGVTSMGLAKFFAATGAKMTEIEYKGAVSPITDLVAGRIQLMFNEIAGLQAQARAGRLRLLAVASPERVTAAPELPTTAEQGYPSVVVKAWYGIFAPAGVPAAVASRLEEAMAAARRSPELQRQLRSLGYEVVTQDDAASFARQVASDTQEARRLLKPPGQP
ncbi:MAG: tripartite tricarboxylate transporter substrate binding protein [Burkholderiales bacterium]|jgi:tripartite-type tricarboxylate transporter receptor subunit TctC|nr:tripartite tricarboxylate transporter substrate binding protein [Burkholderiales bacterium]